MTNLAIDLCSAISWREQIDDICFLLEQHDELGFYIDTSLEPQSTTRQSIHNMFIYRKPHKLFILNMSLTSCIICNLPCLGSVFVSVLDHQTFQIIILLCLKSKLFVGKSAVKTITMIQIRRLFPCDIWRCYPTITQNV